MPGFPTPSGILGGYNPSDIGQLPAIIGHAQVAIEGEFQRATFDWDGNTGIQCGCSELETGEELRVDGGGWEIVRKCTVSVQVSSLPSSDPEDFPSANDDIVIHLSEDDTTGTQLRIKKVKNSYNVALKLECVDSNHATV